MSATGKVQKGVWEAISSGYKTILDSNKAINSLNDFVAGTADSGFRGFANAYKKDPNIGKALSSAYKNNDGTLKAGAIAGSYIGASAGARIVSGGGLTKDRNGNTNIIGVPFV